MSGITSVDVFEQGVYENHEALEPLLSPDDYLELISLNFHGKCAEYEIKRLIKKLNIDFPEFYTRYLRDLPVNNSLLTEFPDFIIDDEDLEFPYFVAGRFVDFIINCYNKGDESTYKNGLCFIEHLHLSNDPKTRELATIRYLESFLDWEHRDILLNDLGAESKKWWLELNLFWSGKIPHIGASFLDVKLPLSKKVKALYHRIKKCFELR